MYALCDNCGTVRGENVSECFVCLMSVEMVSLRKENERLSDKVDELNGIVFELRREASVRNKVCRKVETGMVRTTRAERTRDSPRQEDDRGRAIVVADRPADSWKKVAAGNVQFRYRKVSQPVPCRNRFDCLSDREGSVRANDNAGIFKEKVEALLVGDSMIRHLDKTFQNKDRRKRMRVCFPGARVNDIVDRIDREFVSTKVDSTVIVHVGTNDIGYKRSEELLAGYRRLIEKMKDSGRRCIISGILPRLGAGQEWKSRALCVNDRVRKLCSLEDIRFLDLWTEFQNRDLFADDGVHLSRKGVEVFSAGLETCLSKN